MHNKPNQWPTAFSDNVLWSGKLILIEMVCTRGDETRTDKWIRKRGSSL